MKTTIEAFTNLWDDTYRKYKGISSPDSQKIAESLWEFWPARIYPLTQRIGNLEKKHYTLAFYGLTNVGKSTLAEALLEAPVAPAISGPGTSFPIEYRYGSKWMLEIHATVNTQKIPYDSAKSLGEDLKPRCLGLSSTEAADVIKACVFGPMPLLNDGLVLADTPGFGAASADGQLAEATAAKLQSFCEGIDEIYFCISSSDGQVKKEETDFFKKIQNQCRTVVITKWGEEDETQEDEQKYRKQYEKLFHPARMVFVGAKEHLGIDPLKALIQRNANADNRRKECNWQIAELWKDINQSIYEQYNVPVKWDRCRLESFEFCCKRDGIFIDTKMNFE